MHNTIMRNNIFHSIRYVFEASITGSMEIDWDYDNRYPTCGTEGHHFIWKNIRYYDFTWLCSTTELECNEHDSDPKLTNPENGDYTLSPDSPNIYRGIVISGINDDNLGLAPGIGVYEVDFSSSPYSI